MYLLSLNQRLEDLKGNPSNEHNRDHTEETIPPTPVSDSIEDYVADLFEEDVAAPATSGDSETPLSILNKLECRDKVKVTTTPWTVNGVTTCTGEPFNIIDYWKKRRASNPFCYKLAMIIYAAPSTQVTVERLFSHLKFIMTDFRNKLSDESIKDIMLLRMNKDLLPEALAMLLKQLQE